MCGFNAVTNINDSFIIFAMLSLFATMPLTQLEVKLRDPSAIVWENGFFKFLDQWTRAHMSSVQGLSNLPSKRIDRSTFDTINGLKTFNSK